ncbi:MAG: NUDIX domain-containing protein [Parcubacteria group bacterium]|nr:NUDIX domain-containing protein [Parcubacteria group bacterium]
MKRQRVAAIIIENKKILLVRDHRSDFFEMPGGTLENNEDHTATIARELDEEIGCSIKNSKYYHSFDLINQTYNVPQTDHAYMISIEKPPICSAEICELGWFSKEDITSKKVIVPPAFHEKLYPKLETENFL